LIIERGREREINEQSAPLSTKTAVWFDGLIIERGRKREINEQSAPLSTKTAVWFDGLVIERESMGLGRANDIQVLSIYLFLVHSKCAPPNFWCKDRQLIK
jgi:hypothetical protein